MNNISLSVIIPCYNAEKYIVRSLDSVLKGFSSDVVIEVIVVDDGSTDSSLELIKDYKDNHNIKVIQQKNMGVSDAINAGLEIVSGEYIFVLAADDWCNSDEVLKALKIAKDNNLDICAFGMDYFDENLIKIGSKMRQPIEYNEIITGRDVLIKGYQPSSICVFLMHNKFFKKFDLRFVSGITQNDVEISNRLMLCAERVMYTNLIGYNYFRHSNSITLTPNKKKREQYLKDSITVASNIKSNIKNYDLENSKLIKAITINYNNVVWNLLWRFYQKPAEVDYEFKLKCLQELKAKQLYPIKGALKTSFQRITRIFFNQEFLLKWLMKK